MGAGGPPTSIRSTHRAKWGGRPPEPIARLVPPAAPGMYLCHDTQPPRAPGNAHRTKQSRTRHGRAEHGTTEHSRAQQSRAPASRIAAASRLSRAFRADGGGGARPVASSAAGTRDPSRAPRCAGTRGSPVRSSRYPLPAPVRAGRRVPAPLIGRPPCAWAVRGSLACREADLQTARFCRPPLANAPLRPAGVWR